MFVFPRGKRATLLAQGGAPFSPASISGLVAWYDFSDAATLFTDSARTTAVTADGDAIGGVQDKSGNANHLSQTLTARPLYKTAIKNGKSIARFDGSNDYLYKAFTQAQPVTIFIAAYATDSSARRFFDGIVTNNAAIYLPDTIKMYAQVANLDGPAFSLSTWYIIKSIFNGASSKLSLNAGADSTGNPGSTALGGVTIGASANGTNAFIGDIGEVLLYNSSLSAGDIALVQTYLNTKWAVY